MFVKDVRLQIALTLLIISILSLFHFFSFSLLLTLIFLILSGQFIDIALTYLTQKKLFLSYSALVTASLVFLIIDKNSPLWLPLLTLFIAIASKHLLKIGPGHIFNPAAFGILSVSIIIQTPPSWWGTSWSGLLPLIIILGSFPVLLRLRRLYMVFGFLIIYILYSFVTTLHLNFLFFLDGTIILFAFIMLPEPQTSPFMRNWRYIFGFFVGLLAIPIAKLSSIYPTLDFLIASLLSADLLSFILNNFLLIKKTTPLPTQNV